MPTSQPTLNTALVIKSSSHAGTNPARAAAPTRRLGADSAWLVHTGRLAVILIALGVWQIGSGRWFEAFYFSSPSAVLAFLSNELVASSFYRDLRVTGMELIMGYCIGASSGVALGVLLARWTYVAKVADPFLLAFNSVPRIAIAPMLIVWFGIGMSSKVFLAATLVFFIMFFNTLSGIRGVDRALCNVARILGATEWQIFTKVMLPHASSWIMTGLRMSLPFALVGVVLGEFMVASKGLGYRLNSYATAYNTTGAIAMIIVMMLVMMALTALADRLDKRLMAWRPSNATDSSSALKA